MPNDKDDNTDHIKSMREHLKNAGEHLNNANDTMDRIESMIPTLTGGNPLPRPRPKAASTWYKSPIAK